MERDALLEEYEALCRLTDQRVQKLEHSLAACIKCRPGCHTCCTLSSVLPLEGEMIRKAIAGLNARLQAIIREQAAGSSPFCPILFEGLCLIYEHRPLICRSHGVPVAYIDYQRQTIEVSACPTNFPPDHVMDEAHLLFMDTLNQELHQLNDGLAPRRKDVRESIRDIILKLTG